MATLGLSKVFILDKYFTELQKFWETEKKLQVAAATPGPDRLRREDKTRIMAQNRYDTQVVIAVVVCTNLKTLHSNERADESEELVLSNLMNTHNLIPGPGLRAGEFGGPSSRVD
ncbi:hypothetical protein pipiens_013620 [Culex pipiens pipiens]|uniref:Uncharacterized protein n=1 Tax=Culex pipiens pipiens TaxID=38569 RepID=A0ABD1D074_CULPP